MAGITLDDCIEQFGLDDEVLGTKCSEEHILAVSSFLNWKGVAPYLELTDSEVEAVDSDGKDEADKQHTTLKKWKSKFAFKATYRNLIQALLKSGKGDHAEEVCKLFQKDVLGSQEAAAIGEKNAKDSGEPRQKYRRVMPPEDEQQVQKYRITSLRAEIEDLKEQLQAKEDKLLQKDDELRKVQVQLRDFKSDFQTFQAQLGLPLKLSWKRSSDLPFAMYSSTTRPVTLKGKVYMVGRGLGVDDGIVVVYDTVENGVFLPKRHDKVTSFGMAVVKNQLTLVGGLDLRAHKVTNKLAAWESDSRKWTSPYPPMLTARHDFAVATYSEWMAVAGGSSDSGYLDSVEILNSTEKQWYSAAPLPMGCKPFNSAVVRDEWYLMNCYNHNENIDQEFAVSLPALILLRERASSTPWRNIPSAPLIDTAALAIRDSLFAVVGRTRSTKIITSAIHLYLPWKKKWIEAGRLPTERASCTCIELPSGEILVAGGLGCDGMYTTNRVDIATFMDL